MWEATLEQSQELQSQRIAELTSQLQDAREEATM